MLLSKLEELRTRKERVDQITELMCGLRTAEEEGEPRKDRSKKDDATTPTNPKAPPNKPIPVAQSVQSTGGLSEMVAERKKLDTTSPKLEELQAKLRLAFCSPLSLNPLPSFLYCCFREAAEARRQLVEARRLYDLQTQVSPKRNGKLWKWMSCGMFETVAC